MSDDTEPTAKLKAPETDLRDARIVELERLVAEEREHSAELRRSGDELKFQMDILERSYSKQLKDAREIADSAERSREELAVRVAELDQAREDSIELLAETRTEIDRLTAERDQLRRQLASRDGWEADPADADFAVDPDEGTINTLLDDDSWLRRKDPEREKLAQEEAAREAAAEDELARDMIDPALVFSGRGSRD
jgi:hypothetical protein